MKKKRARTSSVFPERDFPLRVMYVPSHTESQLHGHDFHELVVILGGAGRHITDTEEYPIKAGDVFLLRGKMKHGYADTDRMTLVNILFNPKRLKLPMAGLARLPGYHVLFRVEPKLREAHGFRGRLRLNTQQLAQASKLITLLRGEQLKKREGYRFMSCTHLMHLIGYLSRCYGETEQREHEPLLRIGELLSFIDAHYDQEISVRQLAKQAHMSESSLMRMFREVIGWSPIDYVIRIRVGKAAEFLEEPDLRITEIAFRCGFSDSNYFSRQFRRIKGLSPREYRHQRLEVS